MGTPTTTNSVPTAETTTTMSNRIRNMHSTLFVPRDQLDALYNALREAPLWVSPFDIAHALNLKELLNACGHAPRFDKMGNMTAMYVNGEGYDETSMATLYHLLGPFVQAGGVQEFSDEYGSLWRWEFTGTAAIRQTGRVVYENDPTTK